MNKFIDRLKTALNQSCNDARMFSDDDTNLINAEYLITVNIAKSIAAMNKDFGGPYKIHLEHSTKKFSSSCPPLLSKKYSNNPFGYTEELRQGNLNTKRAGKIDIAVYTDGHILDKPYCAIEVKGFNPSKAKIIEDLERNLEYFSLAANTGLSELPFSLFAALHSCKNTWCDAKELTNINRITNRYKKYIASLSMPNNTRYNIQVFTIRRGIVPQPDCEYIEMFGLQGNEDYHFIGSIICFYQ
ncbi:hypothetical protein [Methylomonas sp. CM2]|uniref:hypothetical protein n=1 Tax=Methylomonas sp. CM2 TaxID=3417647 RepID=UPI003CF7FCA1